MMFKEKYSTKSVDHFPAFPWKLISLHPDNSLITNLSQWDEKRKNKKNEARAQKVDFRLKWRFIAKFITSHDAMLRQPLPARSNVIFLYGFSLERRNLEFFVQFERISYFMNSLKT